MKSVFSSLEGFFFLFPDQSLQKVRTNYNIPKSNLIASQFERPESSALQIQPVSVVPLVA